MIVNTIVNLQDTTQNLHAQWFYPSSKTQNTSHKLEITAFKCRCNVPLACLSIAIADISCNSWSMSSIEHIGSSAASCCKLQLRRLTLVPDVTDVLVADSCSVATSWLNSYYEKQFRNIIDMCAYS
jgi:hypothetical protein